MTGHKKVSPVVGGPGSRAWLVLLIPCLMVLVACGRVASPPTVLPGPGGPEAEVQTGPTPVVLSMIYQDDFRDQASGWDDAFDTYTMKQYGAAKYHIEVRAPNLFARGLANRDISDFVLEVKTKQEEGPDNNSYGVIFRYQDQDNFYRFDITGDGFFLLSKFLNAKWLTLVDWTPSDAINKGQAENVLRVSCLGQHISAYANGQLLAEATDDSFRHGDMGFFAGTFDQPGVHISFDDLAVWAPPGISIALKATPTPAVVVLTQPTASPFSTVPPVTASSTAPRIDIQATPRPTVTLGAALTPEMLPGYVSAVQPKPKHAVAVKGKIAYPVFDATRGTYDIFLLNLETDEPQKLIENASQPILSPSGKYIAYRSWDNDKRGLISRDLKGTEIWRFTTFSEAARPVWSPKEDMFLYHSRQESDRVVRLYRTREGNAEGLRHDGEVIKGEAPSFVGTDSVVYKGCLGHDCGLILCPMEGGSCKQLTDNLSDTDPVGSPDGTSIVFMSQRAGNWNIYVMKRDGSNLVNLTSDAANEGLPAWSPDGRLIAFLSDRNGHWGLWTMDASGANTYQLLQLSGSPDGKVKTAQDFESLGWTEEQISWSQ